MSQKIVFLDIDGTMFEPEIGIPESTVEAIGKLLENNHLPIISTGRCRTMITGDLLDLGFRGIIAAAGTDITYGDEEIYHIKEGTEIAKKMGELLYEGNCRYILEGPEYVYYDSRQKEELKNQAFQVAKVIGFTKFKSIDEGEVLFNKISADTTKESVIHPELKERYDLIFHSTSGAIEFVPKGHSKASGVKRILDYLGVDRKDTYAFGDSNNDIDMLEYVEYGVAMGNAYPDVLEKAKYTTKSIYEDGLYYGLKDFGLI